MIASPRAGLQTPGLPYQSAQPLPSSFKPPFDVDLVRRDFPILRKRVNGRPLVWLDNAATTQKPLSVIQRISYFYEHENSNIHRAADAEEFSPRGGIALLLDGDVVAGEARATLRPDTDVTELTGDGVAVDGGIEPFAAESDLAEGVATGAAIDDAGAFSLGAGLDAARLRYRRCHRRHPLVVARGVEHDARRVGRARLIQRGEPGVAPSAQPLPVVIGGNRLPVQCGAGVVMSSTIKMFRPASCP